MNRFAPRKVGGSIRWARLCCILVSAASAVGLVAAGVLWRVDVAAAQALRRAPAIASSVIFNARGRGTLTLKALRGSVVLVVFWVGEDPTFGRIAGVLNRWYQAYRPQGFEIIGVHAPAWDYQKAGSYVYGQINRLQIKFPVIVDNDGRLRAAYGELAGPSVFLVDRRGYLRAQYACVIDLAHVELMLQSLIEESGDP